MNTKDRQATIERYNKRLKQYGYDPRTLGWFKNRQPVRFKALTDIGKMQSCSILDVGCGFGDLLDFLDNNCINVNYTGHDINPNLIEIAKEKHPDIDFEVMDIEKVNHSLKFDWILSSGVFNHEISDNKKFIENSLTKMFNLCQKGVAVDFLSTYVDYQEVDAHYSDPKEVFDFCRSLTKWVTLRHDYLPYEFCIYMYKKEEFSNA